MLRYGLPDAVGRAELPRAPGQGGRMGRVMRVEGGGAQQEDLFGDAGGEISPEPVLMALQASGAPRG